MLKSTHKAAASASPLPPGWTEHKAPTGHSYYYNAQTKQSTYTRPGTAVVEPAVTEAPSNHAAQNGLSQTSAASVGGAPFLGVGQQPAVPYQQSGDFRGGRSYQDRNRRKDNDRPKSKHEIPGVEPWILVKTKFGRRFVYHPEKNESFWKFPQDVLLAVFTMDENERERKEKGETEPEVEATVDHKASVGPEQLGTVPKDYPNGDPEDSDSYEEVEVTDEEDGGMDLDPKRQKLDEDEAPKDLDFGEDDIEYQLAAMGEDYGLDPEEYGEDGAEIGLSKEDSEALFRDLLDDFRISPYTTWEKIIEEGRIVEDDRYTVLPNMRSRKEAFSQWSNKRIHELKERRLKEEKKDPKIAYLRFLHENATPKLYWPEFKRKFKKEAEMRDTKLDDKTREKFYRDHIARLKTPESTRKTDLSTLLKSIPIHSLNQSSTLNTLPPSITTDLRFISIPSKSRDPLIEAYISTLPPPPEAESGALSAEEQAEFDKRKAERTKREKALAERERMVQEEQMKQRGALRQGREMLREGEMEIEEALRVNRDGLRGYAPDEEMAEE